MKLSLGPLTYCWDKTTVEDYYQNIAHTNIDTVYLGEVVCNRRRELKLADYLDIANQLVDSGKNVVLSTMTLIESSSELTELKRIIDNGRFAIEANDMSAVHMAHQANVPFVCGPSLNLYNRASIDIMQKLGMTRFVMPYELSKKWLSQVLSHAPASFEVEVLGHGYMPLAHSARCFTAKHHNKPKLECDIICKQHPKGLLTQTQESQALLRINGIQTQSAAKVNLINEMPDMQKMGVDFWRLSPTGLSDIALIEQLSNPSQPLSHDAEDDCNGYWFSQAGMALVEPQNV
ncbi:U32 family peptidase [Shewanella gaetbuli]